MSVELGTNWHVENNLQYRLRKLHELTGMTHPQIVRRSNGMLRREDLVKLGRGGSKATTYRIRKGLALGYGVPDDLMNRLIDGKATPEEVAAKVPPLTPEELRPESEVESKQSHERSFGDLPEWKQMLDTAMKRDPSVREAAWDRVSKMPLMDDLPSQLEWVLAMGQALERQMRALDTMRQQRAPVGKFSARQTGQIKKPKRH